MTQPADAIDTLCINTLRTLSIDAAEKASSGHPGLPMGAATMAYVLWTRHMRYDPTAPDWINRDRFVLSAGHGSMLLYSLLFMTGYGLAIDDLQHFRRWDSRTLGHPERGVTPGVEVTSGPLGQGFGNAVGMAMAERWLAATFNRLDRAIVDHHTFVIASDGDLMEGIVSEAASLAGDLHLGRLVVLYDANKITLSASTNITFSEPEDETFRVPDDAQREFDTVRDRGAAARATWQAAMDSDRSTHPELVGAFDRATAGELPPNWDSKLPVFTPNDGDMATRDAGGKAIAAIAESVANLIGGSADLDPSTRTAMKGKGDFQSPAVPGAGQTPPTQGMAGGAWGYGGRNVHFGIREHAMTAILTGMAHHGGVIPFGAAFLTFSDYMRPSIRNRSCPCSTAQPLLPPRERDRAPTSWPMPRRTRSRS